MNISTEHIKKYQMGGAAPAPQAPPAGAPPEAAPAPEGAEGGDPLMALAELAMQGLQNQDCNALTQMAEQFLTLLNEAQGGGEQAPPPEQTGAFRKGGKILAKR